MGQSQSRWWASPRAMLRSLLTIDDTHHSIALGTAIGVFIGLTPTVGIQMMLVGLLAVCTYRLFQFNRVAALITVYVSNPLTTIPIYYFAYWVGTFFVEGDIARQDFERILKFEGLAGWWDAVLILFIEIGTPLLIGTGIVASMGGVLTYPAMRWLLRWFHRTPRLRERASTVEVVSSE